MKTKSNISVEKEQLYIQSQTKKSKHHFSSNELLQTMNPFVINSIQYKYLL